MKRIFIIFMPLFLLGNENLNFEYILNSALKNSPAINISKIDAKSAIYDYDYAKSAYYPNLALVLNSGYSMAYSDYGKNIYVGNENLPSNTEYQNSASIVLNYDIFRFGADKAKVDAAKENIEALNYKVCSNKIDLSLDLLDKYTQLLLLKNKIDHYKKLKTLYERRSKYSAMLNEVGLMDKVNVNSYLIELKELSKEILEDRYKAEVIINYINKIANIKIRSIDDISYFNNDKSSDNLLSFDKTYKAKSLLHQEKQIEYEIENSKKEFYPTISLYARYDFYGDDENSYSSSYRNVRKQGYRVGLSIRWDLFDGGRKKARLEQNELKLQRLRYERLDAKLSYEKEISNLKAFNASKEELEKLANSLKLASKKNENMLNRLNKAQKVSKLDVVNNSIQNLQRDIQIEDYLINLNSQKIKTFILSNQTKCY